MLYMYITCVDGVELQRLIRLMQ